MLSNEINDAQRLVRTDAYQMSIGELVSMYEAQEIKIDPEFQRLFRWEISQKSKLIESILLGIPLPPIFVYEKDDGNWELVDGLQRLSTILEFMGHLHDSDGNRQAPLILDATKYLPSLHNVVWEKTDQIADVPENDQRPLEKTEQLAIRRARIGVEILKRPSDNQTKFDLFQRLNAGGTLANAQELRNCIMLMVNRGYFQALKAVAESAPFLEVAKVSSGQREKQRHMELAVRFLVHTLVPYDGTLDVEEFVDDGIVKILQEQDQQTALTILRDTFELLSNAAGENALRRYDGENYVGKVGLVALEGIAVGIGRNIATIRNLPDPTAFVLEKSQAFWQDAGTNEFTSPGMRGTTRILRTVPFGEQWFK
ncbi:DUF262 domain-containing protein [Verrucomicrobiaceae bacterium 5K15]|uniref:DUF262 domain-containing protein n=1 Tax=Oceaniferula flava TaxID=2800421 RepID=A0AAE2VC98_9BACT|nr:DUF262 domain-containing protein [Oceaniferula flavus]MBK1854756.1 DUF262 domain-containing protein [Oceaniferula flavus]MBM1136062.1 DUF262 domain-containing protein [Oceaniferula flavus]